VNRTTIPANADKEPALSNNPYPDACRTERPAIPPSIPARATTYSAGPRRPGLLMPPRLSAISVARPNAVQDPPESRAESSHPNGPNEDARRPSAFGCFDQILEPLRRPSTT
jgi:hypothetical protein